MDNSAVLDCHPSWRFDDQSAEAAMLSLLQKHPSRVHSPDAAELFVVPIMPYVSWCAGVCHGETHEERMAKARDALLKSPHLAAKGGRDHLLVTNTFRVRTFGKEFKRLLANATVAWFEQPIQPGGVRQNRVLYNLAFWRCTVVIPYLANPFCAIQPEGRFSSDAEAWKTLRTSVAPSRRHKRPRVPGSIFFQGSWAAAQMVRKHFSELQSMPGAHVHDVPRGCNLPENATKAVCIAARVRGTRLQTARGMLAHEFCLVPRGDTPTSGRLFGALACRCVPIIIANKYNEHHSFAAQGHYDQWTLTIGEQAFMRDAKGAVEKAIAEATPRMASIRQAMDAASTELLYDAPGSRAAENLLTGWSRQCT